MELSSFSKSFKIGYDKLIEKEWDVNGDTADIVGDDVEITNVDANRYGDQKMNLKAKKGIMNKASGNVHLEKDVVITSADGRKLITDSLDWNKDQDLVVTDDKVTLKDDDMVATGTGLEAKPGLKTAKMKRDVEIEIEMDDAEAPETEKIN